MGESSNQRRLSRIKITYYLRVFDADDDRLVGHVADISVEGMMLVSDRPIPTDRRFHLWMEIPGEGHERERVYIEADSVWSRQDANPDFYDIGFSLVDPPRPVVRRITDLIDQFTL